MSDTTGTTTPQVGDWVGLLYDDDPLSPYDGRVVGVAPGGLIVRFTVERVYPPSTLTEAYRTRVARRNAQAVADCTCVTSCGEDPATACSLSGVLHVHPDDGSGTFGPCPEHPEAPGDH